jgi:CPA2 family monovalent cation:H+ antiporter-2
LVALGTAQIGEFSFVLADLGRRFEVMQMETYNLILGAAMISIALNPFLMRLAPDAPPSGPVPPSNAEPKPESAPASA